MAQLTFVNLSHPSDLQKRNVQKNIRHHVMKRIGRSRRKRPRATVIPLQVRTESPGRIPDRERASLTEIADASGKDVHLSPSRSLNPCGMLGDLDARTLQILHFSKPIPVPLSNPWGLTTICPSLVKARADCEYNTYCKIWIRMGFSDPTAFKLSMASSMLFWDQVHGKPDNKGYHENPESTRYYFEGLGQLSRRLRDPRDCVSAGVIASILGCICHDVCHLQTQRPISCTRVAANGTTRRLSAIGIAGPSTSPVYTVYQNFVVDLRAWKITYV